MSRIRVSTTVDGDLLTAARAARDGVNDARILDEALKLLVDREREAAIDASYAIYQTMPLSMPDAWGNLEEFMDALKEPDEPSESW